MRWIGIAGFRLLLPDRQSIRIGLPAGNGLVSNHSVSVAIRSFGVIGKALVSPFSSVTSLVRSLVTASFHIKVALLINAVDLGEFFHWLARGESC